MAAGSTFDQWQKDVFFSAAEEVQESADIMESMYRVWIRDRNDGFYPDVSEDLRNELRTSLGTAKWQLEEFVRAVNSSYGNNSSEESTITRHRQFIAAIENKISCVEMALSEEGKRPLRWVQLDKEERDDLAVFLSSTPQSLQEATTNISAGEKYSSDQLRAVPYSVSGSKDRVIVGKDVNYVDKVVVKETLRSKGMALSQVEQSNGQSTVLSSPDTGEWKILIDADKDMNRTAEGKPEPSKCPSSIYGLLKSVELTAKSNLFRNSFPKAKNEERRQLRRGLLSYLDLKVVGQGVSRLNDRSRACLTSCREGSKVSKMQQLVGKAGVLQRHIQGSHYFIQYGRSLRVTLLLILTIFLVVPFVLYST